MCGIIGYIGFQDAIPIVLDGLKRLEYRGYDSAGMAYIVNNTLEVKRCKGKIKNLEGILPKGFSSNIAIGHTRWATHGKPSDENAHPHRSGQIVIVHNGIIENYVSLKNQLLAQGVQFTSETDTEAICHLINSFYSTDVSIEDAVRKALPQLRGAYAFAVISEREPNKIVAVRKESPLVLGLGQNEMFFASDVPAFLNHCRHVIFMDNFEMAIIEPDGVLITDFEGNVKEKQVTTITWSPSMAEKGGYKHFMLKEIYEQPRCIADILRGRIYPESHSVVLDEFALTEEFILNISKIVIVACGTSYHSALAGKYMIENIAKVPVDVDIASEYRYRNPIIDPSMLFVAVTQSGETADTLAAMTMAQSLGAKALAICNVIGSTAAREADFVFYTHSGPEIGVASTKAFTAQLTAFYLLAIALAQTKQVIPESLSSSFIDDLMQLPSKVEKTLELDSQIQSIARHLFKAKDFLYIGRGINYPIALEGALKLKEISYIHAEGYPAGEMKHGPIALLDEEMPVVVIAPEDRLFEKMLSNMQEAKSRGATLLTLTTACKEAVNKLSDYCIEVDTTNEYLMPVLLTIPLQMLAYHIAVLRGCDVDQPRNLAKSVTVE